MKLKRVLMLGGGIVMSVVAFKMLKKPVLARVMPIIDKMKAPLNSSEKTEAK